MTQKGQRVTFLTALFTLLLAATVPYPAAGQLGARSAEEWAATLERPERLRELKIDELIEILYLRPGTVVADVGAGTGAFSRPFAKAVAPTGKVYAVDIQQDLLDYIADRAKKEAIGNIVTILGDPDDPKLPEEGVDLVFFHDVLHHIARRDLYLKNVARYVKPGGRIVVIERLAEDHSGPHAEQPEMQVSKENVDRWMEAAGFYPGETYDLYPGQKWFVIYSRGSVMEHEH